jgi:hypothetical protein
VGVDTTVDTASCNGRRSTLLLDKLTSHSWPKRRPYMAAHLQKIIDTEGMDVMFGQEWTDEMAVQITNDLGGHWAFSGGGDNSNCILMYNGLTMQPVPGTLQQLPVIPGCTIQKMVKLSTGEAAWFVSGHLVSGSGNGVTRAAQIRQIGRAILKLPDNLEVIGGFDLNDNTDADAAPEGIRRIAQTEFGLHPIRSQLDNGQIAGESIDSTHDWTHECEARFRWKDDVLTRSGARITRARLFHTCRSTERKVAPTDHNTIWARVVY